MIAILRSMKTALVLLILLALFSIAGTINSPLNVGAAGRLHFLWFLLGLSDTYHSPPFIAVSLLLLLNIGVCAWSRVASRLRSGQRKNRSVLWVDAGMHGALVVMAAGGIGKALLGVVGTGYLFLGLPASTMTDPVRMQDLPLGFSATLLERKTDYYPLQLRIGVKEASTGRKLALVEVRQGRPTRLDVEGITLDILKVSDDGGEVLLAAGDPARPERLRFALTNGAGATVPFRTFLLSVIAYRRDVRSVRGLVAIKEEGQTVREDWLEVNKGIEHRGTKLFLVGWSRSPEGPGEEQYLGVQYRRDPAAPVFWAGAVSLSVLLPLFVLLRRRRHA